MKPKTKNDYRYNSLRSIIRNAMNDTKSIEWNPDNKVSKCATWQWNKLEEIFQKLGSFANLPS